VGNGGGADLCRPGDILNRSHKQIK
jgi:hypothetical protein